jgi:hypothetical protein
LGSAAQKVDQRAPSQDLKIFKVLEASSRQCTKSWTWGTARFGAGMMYPSTDTGWSKLSFEDQTRDGIMAGVWPLFIWWVFFFYLHYFLHCWEITSLGLKCSPSLQVN